MYVEYFVIISAKYMPPAALVLFILSQFFYIPESGKFIGIFLFGGWWASCEICSAYEKYEAKRQKEKEV